MIGIIADSHDNMDAIKKAVNFLNSRREVNLVLHAGDFVAPFTVKEFKNLKKKMLGVFGNNDGERKGLKEKFSEIKVEIKDFHELKYENKKIALYHGTSEDITKALIKCKKYDVLILGHTHKAEIKKILEKTLVINPGEVCGYLTGKRTLALLDTKKMVAKIFEF